LTCNKVLIVIGEAIITKIDFIPFAKVVLGRTPVKTFAIAVDMLPYIYRLIGVLIEAGYVKTFMGAGTQ
jgi:hypothetical protein